MGNQGCESVNTVTLVLRDDRVEASKDKLARKSLYFASLFSENFKDHRQKEFAINYEMSLGTLQDFVGWANTDGSSPNDCVDSVRYNFTVKKSLQKFLDGNRSELLELLELSVVFMAEKLTEDITEIIICMRLPPDDMLEIWLLAESLGLKALEDAALATCLDKFDELSITSLVDLSLEHLVKLLCNSNVRSSPERLMNVREAWVERNGHSADMPDSSSRFLEGEPDEVIEALKEAKPHYMQCVVGHKLNKAQFVYAWNGKSLREVTEIGREIIARQVVARGFSIYVVGRKQGVNVGQFNTTIWRFCVFTKKWYIETILPRRRKNMAVICLGTKLYLFGGIDATGRTIPTVDVYDVHSGVWSKTADIPETHCLTEVRSACVVDGKILYRRHMTHVYDPVADVWHSFHVQPSAIPARVGREWAHIQLPLGSYKQPCIQTPVVYVRNWLPQSSRTTLGIIPLVYDQYLRIQVIHNWGKAIIDQQVMNAPRLVSFGFSKGRAYVEDGRVNQTIEGRRNVATYTRLKTHSQELHDVPANCFKLDTGRFNLIEPESLHTTITMPETISIGDDFTAVQRKRRMRSRGEPQTLN